MHWSNKVVWSEGLFLRPQIFQQQERYLEHLVHQRNLPQSPYFWGFSHLQVDEDSLPLGRLALRHCVGIFQDGTPFQAPAHAPLPPPLAVTTALSGQIICLALPLRGADKCEISFAETSTSCRYGTCDALLEDNNSLGMEAQCVQLAELRLRLLPEKQCDGKMLALPVAKILEVRSDGGLVLDNAFVPSVNTCAASDRLTAWLTEIHGLVHLRATALAQSLLDSGSDAAVTEVADYLLLQILNRHEPVLAYMAHSPHCQPESLYLHLLGLTGELSTFLRFQTRRPAAIAPYDHARPGAALQLLLEDLRMLLHVVFERGAVRIPLEDLGQGQRAATLSPQELRRFGALVLSVSAQMPRDILAQEFAAKTKISSPHRLPQLVRSHLPGLPLQMLPVAPRQIPFHVDSLYFELRRQGTLWEQICESGGLAIHVAGEFPVLRLELWGTRPQ